MMGRIRDRLCYVLCGRFHRWLPMWLWAILINYAAKEAARCEGANEVSL